MPTINKPQPKPRQRTYGSTKYDRYYATSAWRNLRDDYIRCNPLCECCLGHERVTPATQVHHKYIFFRGTTESAKMNLLLDRNNLMSVCNDCHKRMHQYADEYSLNYVDDVSDTYHRYDYDYTTSDII